MTIALTLPRDNAHVHVDLTCTVANNGYLVGNVVRTGMDGFNFLMRKNGAVWTLITRAGFPQIPSSTGVQVTLAASQWTIQPFAF